jgi:hypothetical protein
MKLLWNGKFRTNKITFLFIVLKNNKKEWNVWNNFIFFSFFFIKRKETNKSRRFEKN